MAAPTQPTAATICAEAYKLAGISSPGATKLTRAADYGFEKVKRDIMLVGRTWRPLLQTAYDITAVGVSHYANPTDLAEWHSIGYMGGTHSGTLSAVVSGSAMSLAAAEDATQIECEGKWLLITGGTGVDQAEQIDNYNTTTKAVALRAALTTQPTTSSTYLVVDSIKNLTPLPVKLYNQYEGVGLQGTPSKYANIENTTDGNIALYPVPNAIRGLREQYYVDLLQLDMAGTLYSTILTRWCGVLTQGVFAWILQDEDDGRAGQELAVFLSMLAMTANQDLDGKPDSAAFKQVQPQGVTA